MEQLVQKLSEIIQDEEHNKPRGNSLGIFWEKKMSSIDIHNEIQPVVALDLDVYPTGTANGNVIDTQGLYSLELLAQSGVVFDGSYSFTIEHGDDSALADAAGVPSQFLLGAVSDLNYSTADDFVVKKIGYVGHKRYVRINIIGAGITISSEFGVTAMLKEARSAPTT